MASYWPRTGEQHSGGSIEIPILYLDEYLLVVNKPAGLRSIADGYDASLPHLSGVLQAQYGRLWTVHRLDKDTSGAIIFARTPEGHRALSVQFEQRSVQKTYHALVLGQPDWEQQEVDLPLRVNGDRRHRTVIDPAGGQPARTSLQLLARYWAPAQPSSLPPNQTSGALIPLSLIAAHPYSGYTHQIRAHLSALRLPLFGDPLYKSQHPDDRGQAAPNLPFQRTALHARRVAFLHPVLGTETAIEAPYPLDFEETLMLLDKQKQAGS